MEEAADIETELLRADSLWASGEGGRAVAVVAGLETRSDWDAARHGPFAVGLRSLAISDLPAAFEAYRSAAAAAVDGGAVFPGERAVNVAFWMACAGKMLEAGCLLGRDVARAPFAGGVLAFAQHMAGNSELAEATAREAIAAGFRDPWTLHAVAHCLYSLGRSAECAEWLRAHRAESKDCTVFMRTHMEFHLALCLLDVEDGPGFSALVDGPLWGDLPAEERKDYWAATGVLCALWKAELRGIGPPARTAQVVASALEALRGADPLKSKVFGLCVLRHDASWLGVLQAADDDVLAAAATAVDAAYRGDGWVASAQRLAPVLGRLDELGASPEQREVLHEFAVQCCIRGGLPQETTSTWLGQHRRPGIAFYDSIGTASKC